MKAVILAGGLGTRLFEETDLRPKPMVEIGGKPVLWHIMKTYSAHGVNDFIICCGYKGYLIKEYFANYFLHMSDVTFSMKDNAMEVHDNKAEPWRVTLVDTGENTLTGGRLKRVQSYVEKEESFCFTYGDGVGDDGNNNNNNNNNEEQGNNKKQRLEQQQSDDTEKQQEDYPRRRLTRIDIILRSIKTWKERYRWVEQDVKT